MASDSASCWQRKKTSASKTFERFFALPPEATGAARGYHVNVTRRLAALAPRVPHVGLPCEALRVAGESADGVWASYLRLDPLALTSTESIPRPDYPSEFH